MPRTTSITIGSQMNAFVGQLIDEGRYGNASEVVRAGLRLLEREEQATAVLRREIQKGLDSGISHRNLDEISADVEKRLGV